MNRKLTAVLQNNGDRNGRVELLQFVGETRVIVLLEDETLQSVSIYDLKSVGEENIV